MACNYKGALHMGPRQPRPVAVLRRGSALGCLLGCCLPHKGSAECPGDRLQTTVEPQCFTCWFHPHSSYDHRILRTWPASYRAYCRPSPFGQRISFQIRCSAWPISVRSEEIISRPILLGGHLPVASVEKERRLQVPAQLPIHCQLASATLSRYAQLKLYQS